MARTKRVVASSMEQRLAIHFGAFLKSLRSRYSIRQAQVLAHLPHWTQANFSRVENDEQAPPFDQLAAIYAALCQAGAELTPQDRQQFLALARVRIEIKKSHLDRKSDQEWEALRVTLSQYDHRSATLEALTTHQERLLAHPGLMETRHLLGRADWLASVITTLQTRSRKIVVLQGPSGIGKSSELHRLANYFLNAESHPHVVLCMFPNVEQEPEPENTLDALLGSLLAELSPGDEAIQGATRALRITAVLNCLEKTSRSVLVLVDNAEHLMEGRDRFAPGWEDFLERFLRSKHHATLILATKEWPGWRRGEGIFIEERMVPAFTTEEGAALLQQIGLSEVPVECLQQVSEAVGGIPQCLDWVASLAKEPLWLDAWDELDDLNYQEEGASGEAITRRLLRLLQDRALLSGKVTSRLNRLLERIITYRLSAEATQVLQTLSLAPLPLGKPALEQLCPRPSLLKELRTVSLLTAHSQRVQVLPMVAAAVHKRLSPEQQRQIEEHLIVAYQRWLDTGEMSDREMGMIIAELIALYLKQDHLLDAAQRLILHGWMSFNQGQAARLAHIAQQVLQQTDWHVTVELECAGFAILNILFPFLGKPFNPKSYVSYDRIREAVSTGSEGVPVEIVGYLTQLLMEDAMNRSNFEEAHSILKAYLMHLERRGMGYMQKYSSVLHKRAWLLTAWCEYVEEQGDLEKAQALRNQAIEIYWRGDELLSSEEGISSLNKNIRQKRLAIWLTNLSYHLNRVGQYQEALRVIERAIVLHKQGYAYVGDLANSFGEKSQILMELGRLDEAVEFDEKAIAEIQRCADVGDVRSQEDVWTYLVNRGRLYLRLGKIDEAEQLLLEAEPHIHPRRAMYRMFANQALAEIREKRESCKEAEKEREHVSKHV